jgi:hypothetical protein
MATRRSPQPPQRAPAQRRQQPAQRPAPAPARQSNLARREPDPFDDAEDDVVSIVKPDSAALEALTKSEVSMQLDAAHRWPRDTRGFVEEAVALSCYQRETAESCTFTLFRKEKDEKGAWVDKPITGPSVRLAEIVAPTWGNLHIASRIIDEGPRTVTAQSIAWDLEKNLRLGVEVQRGIVTKKGDRYGDDMIRVTMMAAMSIAFRNAVFRVIPRALVNAIWEDTKAYVRGDGKDLPERRDRALAWFAKRGLPIERLLVRMGVGSIEELTDEHCDILSGLCQSLKQNIVTMDEAFPVVQAVPPAGAQQQRSKGAALDALANAHKKSEPPPANSDLPLTPEAVHRALADADEAWEPAHLIEKVRGWTPEAQRIAYDWAMAFIDTPQDEPPPEQPEFTLLPREMGEEG